MVLKDIPADARLRKKLPAHGAAALADAELIALLLRTGLPDASLLQLAQQLLDRFGGISDLLHTDVACPTQVAGLGSTKRAELAATIELARRALAQELAHGPLFAAPAKVRQYLKLPLAAREHEVFAVLFLDAQNRLIRFEDMFRGTLSHTSDYPPEVVKRTLTLGCATVIVARHHPTRAAEPSRADEHLTRTLKSALLLIDVRVLDHLVVGQGKVVPLAERGLH